MHIKRRYTVAGAIGLAVTAVLAGCATFLQPAPAATSTFGGTMPCADCPGITTTLTLSPALEGDDTATTGTFTLSELYQDRSFTPATTTGSWRLLPSRNGKPQVIDLAPTSNAAAHRYFAKISRNVLQVLDGTQNPLPGPLPQVLTRQPS